MGIFNHMNDNPNNKVISSNKNKSTFFINVYFKKTINNHRLYLNDGIDITNGILIPFDCHFKEISLFISSLGTNNEDFLITIILDILRTNSITYNYSSSKNNIIQNIPINIDLKKSDTIHFFIYRKNGGLLTQNEATFCLVFTK